MRRRNIILLGFVIVASIGALRWFDMHPIEIGGAPGEQEVAGAPLPSSSAGDVLLLIDDAVVRERAEAKSHAGLDLSYGWTNLLETEFGPVSRASPVDADLASARAVVCSSSALAALDIDAARAFVESGGVLFVDAPEAPDVWREELLGLAGVRLGAARVPFSISWVPPGLDAVDADDWRSAPIPVPDVSAQLVPVGSGARRMGDAGVWIETTLGRGRIVVSSTPLGRWFVTMTQGAPSRDDFVLEERLGDYPEILEPDDLVDDARRRTNEIPFADLLSRAVTRQLDPPDAPPLPRLLWFPAASQGVVLMTHDEDFQGGAATKEMHDWDAQLGVKGTSFVIAHPRMSEDWDRDALSLELGLHWNRFAMPHGVGPIEPVEWAVSCEDQETRLGMVKVGRTSGLSVPANRNHYLIIGPTWTSMFRVLAANRIELDSTFGANKGRGYLFGTARPYRIVDENGFVLPIRELPFVNQEDWGDADPRYFTRLMETNAARHKGALVLLFHPHLIVRTAEGAALFEHAAREALRTGHRPLTTWEFLQFWKSRAETEVRSRVIGPRALELSAVPVGDDQAVAFPEAERRVGSVHRGGVSVDVLRRTIGGVSHAIITLEGPDDTFEVRFEEP